MKALFIGRFQPFHLGHLQVVKSCLNQFTFCYIGVGSSQSSNTFENPFTFDERKHMITDTLDAENIHAFSIVSIPDINNPPRWVEHVRRIIDDFSFVITNNDFTMKLFHQKGYKTAQPGFFEKEKYSGKEIRYRMKYQEPWEHLVHPKVVEYLHQINAEERLQSL
jgi:nicotinamide-nucleotide adenylyltransferase